MNLWCPNTLFYEETQLQCCPFVDFGDDPGVVIAGNNSYRLLLDSSNNSYTYWASRCTSEYNKANILDTQFSSYYDIMILMI